MGRRVHAEPRGAGDVKGGKGTIGTCPCEEGRRYPIFSKGTRAERGETGGWRERRDSLRACVVGLGVRSS